MLIKTSTLKASIHCAANKDTRYYLNGVLVKATGTRLTVVSTNGHALSAFNDELDDQVTEPIEIIIPIDTIKSAAKDKKPVVSLLKLSDGRWSLGDSIFIPIDGRYPDYNRVIPKSDKSGDGLHSNIQPQYFTAATKALNDYYGTKDDQTGHHQDNIENAAVFHRGNSRAVVVVMSWRHTDKAPKLPYMGFSGI